MIYIAAFIVNLLTLGLSLTLIGIGVFILYTVGYELLMMRKWKN